MTKSILIVEDETDIMKLIDWHLQSEGYLTFNAPEGAKGLDIAEKKNPDLIVLDLILPGMDGLEVCKSLKRNSKTQHIPVVMLTARGEEVDRIVGLELGADDYIVKPFSPRELILRIRAILRRHEKPDQPETILKYEDLYIEPDSYRVWIGEEEITLTVTEFNLLMDLLRN